MSARVATPEGEIYLRFTIDGRRVFHVAADPLHPGDVRLGIDTADSGTSWTMPRSEARELFNWLGAHLHKYHK